MWTSRSETKSAIFVIVLCSCVTFTPNGFKNLGALKNALFNFNLVTNTCAGNGVRLLNLVNLVCSTAQAVNATNRDACYGCFARFVSLPQSQQQLLALSLCASTYFTNTSYAPCATRLANVLGGNTAIFTSTLNQCTTGYCEFVQCLRRTNSNNLIIQCSREVISLGAVNITTDADQIRFYTNVTSCILAKTRCGLFNPITGDPQLPGVSTVNNGKVRTQVPLYNTLQVTTDGSLRVVSFPITMIIPTLFCSSQTTIAQSNWVNNECP